MPHQRVTLPLSLFCRILTYKDIPIHSIVHPLQRVAQLLIFCIISLALSVGMLIIQAIFPSAKEFLELRDGSKNRASTRCCATTTNPSPFGQCGRTNSPEWRTAKNNGSQNPKHRWTGENQNEEESNSQANRRDRTSEEDSIRVENELRNMRKEVDELKSAIKDKGGENLDRMIQRMDSPFTNEVLNRPLPPKFYLPQLESYDSSKDLLDHIKSFKTLMLL